ncbi:hypothetical protein WQ54_15190 [Bacillus sp. SA1-12]|nr:hypothetical protein WQ54_15190 [Bacillus sp. SA1-12]
MGISHTYLDTIEKGFDKRSGKQVKPTPETLELISNAYKYPYEDLMVIAGYIKQIQKPKSNNQNFFSEKDERDIAKKLESILNDLESDSGVAFYGEPMDDVTRELVKAQIESNLRTAKQLAKKKFTPKKYRNDDDK